MSANLLKSFFKDNQEMLEALYPGINQKTLQDFYNELTDDQKCFDVLVHKLKQGIPLAHISGKRYFFSSYFIVNSKVLIPRFETEMLVELALKEIENLNKRGTKRLKIAEVGVGTGAIILSILMESEAEIDAVVSDISKDALDVFNENLEDKIIEFIDNQTVKVLECDRLEKVDKGLDLIISNPPYIMKRSDRSMVHEQVLNFEPEIALFLEDEEYFDWFNSFLRDSFLKLKFNGTFLMEGHEFHLNKLKDLALEVGFSEVIIIKDLTNRDRFLRAFKGVISG